MKTDYSEILELLEKYFDLLYEGDGKLINQLFLPEAHVYNTVDNKVVAIDMDQFHERIATRIAPQSKKLHRDDRILSIDIAAPTIALAKVDLFILPYGHFTDYLTLMKVDDRWRIASKVFHMNPERNSN